MGISVADNFDHKSKKPLDARTSYSTLALMKAVIDANINEGCLAYCAETDKYYKFLSTNTVDESTGKWREFSSGGGGGTEYTAGDGIDITNNVISTKQSEEGDMDEIVGSLPSGGMGVTLVNAFNKSDLYSADEKMVGQWTNGKPVYQRTIKNTTLTTISNSSWDDYSTLPNAENIATWHFGRINASGNVVDVMGDISCWYDANTGYLKVRSRTDNLSCANGSVITIQYTKTTDSAVSIGEANEYSTDEKIVGTWISGEPIWQKTFVNENMTLPSGSDHELELADISSLSISKITSITGTAFRNTNPSLFITIPYCPTSTSFSVFVVVRGNKIYINAGDGIFSEIQKCYITLQYTKTTT